MLSGNGRHRRPRQAPALLVAAGVTGSAIAIPLLGASGASAADGTTWDRVADCETGGAWSQNSGNGYFGGLALSQENWENHGGLDYAPSADLASRSQQIAVAERILADQGVGAWRTCGLLSGLEQDKGSDASGSSDSSDSSGSSDSTDSPGLLGTSESSPSADSSPSPSDTSSTEDQSDNSAKSPESADSASRDQQSGGARSGGSGSDEPGNSRQGGESTSPAGTGSGRHRGPSADENAGSASGRTNESAGRHASRGDGASRDAGDGSYVVRSGDSLSAIADSLDLSGGWRALYVGNREAVGLDPNLIRPGQRLTVEGDADQE
ncbi:LysM peptidoglycan-binding domain-containing protein [Streptomyces djakartensis]|uniref:Peptidoglycan-binding protein LysM n=1 Tax=Streptomyces djakartensis TaxID=68193 RepID=A0ABQ2ZSR7_9ACTN|nr:transglycosylase family protein [Streptomyces djakartensis]GGY23209.1 peptidoglycan-binding protein LysM [Streptomyces djakartensis]